MHIYLKMVPGTGGWVTQNRPRATRNPALAEQVRSLGRHTETTNLQAAVVLTRPLAAPPFSARTCACDAAALDEAAQRGILSRAEL